MAMRWKVATWNMNVGFRDEEITRPGMRVGPGLVEVTPDRVARVLAARLQRDESSINLTVADSLLRSGILCADRRTWRPLRADR